MAAIAAGDESAFEQLFERYRRHVARVAGRFFALTQIAVNSCYDQLRRTRRRPEQTLDSSDNEGHLFATQLRAMDPASDVERTAVSRDLAQKLLARLSPDDRMVLTLLDVEGFSVAEIAETTNWSISKVKVRAHRARAHLRKVLRRLL